MESFLFLSKKHPAASATVTKKVATHYIRFIGEIGSARSLLSVVRLLLRVVREKPMLQASVVLKGTLDRIYLE